MINQKEHLFIVNKWSEIMSQVNIMSQEKKMSDKLGQDCIFLLLESKRPGEETEFIHIIIKHKKKNLQ